MHLGGGTRNRAGALPHATTATRAPSAASKRRALGSPERTSLTTLVLMALLFVMTVVVLIKSMGDFLETRQKNLLGSIDPPPLPAIELPEAQVAQPVASSSSSQARAQEAVTTTAAYAPLRKSVGGLIHENLNEMPSLTAMPGMPTGGNRPAPRIYCMVPAMWSHQSRSLMNAVLDTWGQQCDTLKFFIDPVDDPNVVIPKYVYGRAKRTVGEIVQVKDMVRRSGDSVCADGQPCRHIWEKIWRSWVYLVDHEWDDLEWICKIDDDSFFIPSNLRRMLAYETEGWSPDDPHYFGHRFSRPDGDTIVSGVLSCFSRETLRRIAPVFKTMDKEYGPRKNFKSGRCVDREGATEERTTALCLAKIGIKAELACDSKRRERVLPLGIPFTIQYPRKTNTTGWYWHHKPPSTPDREGCCAPDAYGLHGYKVGDRMRDMFEMLYREDVAVLRKRLDLPPKSPYETFEEQEQELYVRAARAGGVTTLPPGHMGIVRVERDSQWWHVWYVLLLRTSLAWNPFHLERPVRFEPLENMPPGAAYVHGKES